MMLSTKKFVFLSVVVIALLSLSAISLSAQTNDPATNRALWLEWVDIEAGGDYSQMERFFAPDIVRHSAATHAVMPDTIVNDLESYRAFLEETRAMFPDYQMDYDVVIADFAMVAFSGRFIGTYVENGNPMNVPMMGFARFERGLVAEIWVEWDNLTWERQMNAIESPVSSIDEITGIWGIFDSSTYLSMEYTAEGTVILGYTPTSGAGEVGTFTISDGQMIIYPSENADCEVIYNVYVSRLDTGEIQYIRHELVGEDCWTSREASLNGTIIYPYIER